MPQTNGIDIKPRNPRPCSIYLSEQLWDALDVHVNATGISRSALIEHLLRGSLKLEPVYTTRQLESYFKNLNK